MGQQGLGQSKHEPLAVTPTYAQTESSAASFIQDPWECSMSGAERGARGSNPLVQHSDY